ncbi:putative cytochrome P450 [Eremomyces bilateralis CBS 781.70]|uniref:Cytochrome P450 n=1 Tax=Eremomyces bilateralis CBS 781.70 TaxID=1392243 RepID=A0A6G1GB17_9PEZI|nr:putative cytochrome P450 [Eremomyces bilateralis CBS 781.70]KAF1815265.1 putative cytochrome P450 [Eremomyces bilateralis CBS 781.70]
MSILEAVLTSIREHWLAAGLLVPIIYIVSVAFYRLYLHPLANVPGPKLAAATWLYEIYFWKKFVIEIGRLHDIYGPIVRITPNEVHVNDPALIDAVYPGGGKKVDKDPYQVRMFGIPDTAFLTIDHETHRIRRGALNRYFSKAAVNKIEPYIREAAEKLCSCIASYAGSDTVTISVAFSSFTTDVITEYLFAKSYHMIDRPHFLPNLQAGNDSLGELLPILKQLPFLHTVMRWIPQERMLKMNPGMASWIRVEQDCHQQVKDAHARLAKPDRVYYTVIDELLHADLPPEEKRDDRLFLEAVVLINAATETTSWNLSLATFYLLHQPHTLATLRQELLTASGDSLELPSLTTLENLPYLQATVAETLRHAYGVVQRLIRVHQDPVHLRSTVKIPNRDGSEKVQVKEVSYVIPKGYSLSMTSLWIHKNPDLFPDPDKFAPERWLDAEGMKRKDLDRYLMSFSKGTRQCLGINLAYAELYICIAAVVLRLGDQLELFETDRSDVEFDHDVFAMRPKPETKGIRVTVR